MIKSMKCQWRKCLWTILRRDTSLSVATCSFHNRKSYHCTVSRSWIVSFFVSVRLTSYSDNKKIATVRLSFSSIEHSLFLCSASFKCLCLWLSSGDDDATVEPEREHFLPWSNAVFYGSSRLTDWFLCAYVHVSLRLFCMFSIELKCLCLSTGLFPFVCVCLFVHSLVSATFIRTWSMSSCTPIFLLKMMMMMMTDESTSHSDSFWPCLLITEFKWHLQLVAQSCLFRCSAVLTRMIKRFLSTKVDSKRKHAFDWHRRKEMKLPLPLLDFSVSPSMVTNFRSCCTSAGLFFFHSFLNN